jgi:hypothetical protein
MKVRIVFPAALVACLFWLQFGPYASYPLHGYTDPWFYIGYFTDYGRLLHEWGFTYNISRLPWILPGMAMFHLLPPMWANMLLSALVMSASASALFLMVGWHYGIRPAILAVAAMITSPYVVTTVIWQYPDGAAMAYAMAALAVLVRPATKKPWEIAIGGALLALSGFTNMAAGVMIVSVLAIPVWRFRAHAVWILAGVTAATIVLMPISALISGHWLFFMPQIDQWIYATKNPHWLADMWGTGTGFFVNATRLFLPLSALVLSGVAFLRRKAGSLAWSTWLALLLCCVLYVFQEFVLHGVGLRVHYHTSYILVPTFIAAGFAFGELWNRGWFLLVPPVALAIAAPLYVNAYHIPWIKSGSWMMLAAVGVAGVLGILVNRWVGCVLLMLSLFMGPGVDHDISWIWQFRPVLHAPNATTGNGADAYQFIIDLQRLVKANDGAYSRRIAFWWDKDEPVYPAMLSVESVFYWHVPGADLVKMPDDELRYHIAPGTRILHVTTHPERIEERDRLLRARGMPPRTITTAQMRLGKQPVTVAMQELDGPPSPAAPQQ